eukprot:Amastigsp_a1137_20.p8 type:complete len:106 gc:universal Amastigsp_a1137_20:1261-1578(+)
MMASSRSRECRSRLIPSHPAFRVLPEPKSSLTARADRRPPKELRGGLMRGIESRDRTGAHKDLDCSARPMTVVQDLGRTENQGRDQDQTPAVLTFTDTATYKDRL